MDIEVKEWIENYIKEKELEESDFSIFENIVKRWEKFGSISFEMFDYEDGGNIYYNSKCEVIFYTTSIFEGSYYDDKVEVLEAYEKSDGSALSFLKFANDNDVLEFLLDEYSEEN